MAIGGVWAEGTWADDAWAENTWAGGTATAVDPETIISAGNDLLRAAEELVRAYNALAATVSPQIPAVGVYSDPDDSRVRI